MTASAPLAARSFLTNLTTWANETIDPTTSGLAAAAGSLLLRNGSYPARPTEIYAKLGAATHAWAKQNLVNLNVYNVQAFGAKGDGATDDTAAIQAAINAAGAAGGGEVYLPATPNFYKISYTVLGPIGCLTFSNVSNIVFRGDGVATKIRQLGNVANHETYMFEITNKSKQIGFYDFYYDNFGITNPDPAQQNHGIQLVANSTDGGDTTDVDIVRVYAGVFVGDAIRWLGSAPSGPFVKNTRVRRCVMNTELSRVAISIQRGAQYTSALSNWIESKEPIHFEPTGGGELLGWVMNYNGIRAPASTMEASIALAGDGPGASQLEYSEFSYNVIPLTTVTCVWLSYAHLVGNVAVFNLPGGTSPSASPDLLEFEQGGVYCTVRANVLEHLFTPASATSTLLFTIDNGTGPSNCVVTDNVLTRVSNLSDVISIIDCNGFTIAGNLLAMDATAGGLGLCIATATQTELEDIIFAGNMALCTGSRVIAPWIFESQVPSGTDGPNLTAQHNYSSGLQTNCVVYNPNTGTPFPILGSGNQCSGTNEEFFDCTFSVTCEGNANGLASQITNVQIVAGPQGQSTCSPGSLCVNTLGAAYTALSYKETGSDTSTGWLGVGESDQVCGAASVGTASTSLFFVPGGMGLAVAQATEMQWAAPRPATIRNLRGLFVAGTNDATNTFHMRKNGADAAVTFAIANNTTSGSDLTHSFSVAAGDLISCRVSKSGIPATPQTNAVLTYGYA